MQLALRLAPDEDETLDFPTIDYSFIDCTILVTSRLILRHRKSPLFFTAHAFRVERFMKLRLAAVRFTALLIRVLFNEDDGKHQMLTRSRQYARSRLCANGKFTI